MHMDAYFFIFMGFYESLIYDLWVCLYDVYDISMHDYMMMHDAIYFLYAIIDVPL